MSSRYDSEGVYIDSLPDLLEARILHMTLTCSYSFTFTITLNRFNRSYHRHHPPASEEKAAQRNSLIYKAGVMRLFSPVQT